MISGLLVGFSGAGFAAYFLFMLRENRTPKADLTITMFLPWWPWLEGMLETEGLPYRKPLLIAFLAFLFGFALIWIALVRAGIG